MAPSPPTSNVEVTSHDKTTTAIVNSWGHPAAVQLEDVLHRSGAQIAAGVMEVYNYARTVALARHNQWHYQVCGTWLEEEPGPAHVEALRLSF
ncbi:hypothetical protein [Mycobacteroides abscessus]|uniref:hypothetical protein n=1 Tax=Mycobacteroides abscessus TaxID=36809 RepID=UPI0009276740|nr:hypothetical protein [Mycobacteroides abscessus]MBN7488248.1 hypothetical protein [Mycobacteroides abscessus subsp. abscessus]RIS77951.1 hypothetical protein D2E54_15480 [Mycobacteroides abscessus]SIA41612.1 Uncharacterised protein [Mycobacteroides abscessus subsp. abscessus]SIA57427.1 Uncharacterised protein [Mycobacteroides abscessus subsp. abscessus]SKR74946.1 Uncharacterised protein [Mycobacteroides abscessus subsp. massiliense]